MNDENQYGKPAAAPSLCARVCVSVFVLCAYLWYYCLCYAHTHTIIDLHAYACVLLYVPNTEQPPLCECVFVEKNRKNINRARGKQVEKKA